MDKFWLKSYEAGVPAEIEWTQYRSLTHLLEEAFQKYADRKAYACMGKSMTFAELDRMSARMAAWPCRRCFAMPSAIPSAHPATSGSPPRAVRERPLQRS